MTPRALIDAYVASQQSALSRENVRYSFARVARILKVGVDELPFGRRFDARTFDRIKTGLVEHRPPLALSTTRGTLQHVRGVMRYAWLVKAITREHWDRLERSFTPIRGSRVTKGHSLTTAEVRALVDQCAAYDGVRASMLRALILVAVGTGLRRTELCTLRTDKVRDDALSVVGKGNREIRCPLDHATHAALNDWLRVRANLGWNHKLVFATPTRGVALRPVYVSQVVRKLSLDAGLKQAISPHDFRRTFASAMLEAGLSLPQVQRLMHHEHAETTARYDRREEAALDEARRKVGVPWTK